MVESNKQDYSKTGAKQDLNDFCEYIPAVL